MKNLTGQKFGRLTVIKDSGKRSKKGEILWSCKCDCGNQTSVRTNHLSRKNTLSCGCYRRECMEKRDHSWRKPSIEKLKRQRIHRNKKSQERYHKIKNSMAYIEKKRKSDRKIQNNPISRLNVNLRRSINRSLKHGKMSAQKEQILGYTLKELICHLEKQFQPNMTWENYGSGWHVDHKIPLAVFNFEKPTDIDFKRAWALENLQPLWANENVKKQDKLDKPFQPSLILS